MKNSKQGPQPVWKWGKAWRISSLISNEKSQKFDRIVSNKGKSGNWIGPKEKGVSAM